MNGGSGLSQLEPCIHPMTTC